MFDKAKIRIFFIGAVIVHSVWAAGNGVKQYEYLPLAKITDLKKGPCTLIHVWATWCTTCTQELPSFLNQLGEIKKVHPVVIDVSNPAIQESFSRGFVKAISPKFVTYRKPPGQDEPYLKAIDGEWHGGLPYTALYRKGKKLKQWLGEVNVTVIRKTVQDGCP